MMFDNGKVTCQICIVTPILYLESLETKALITSQNYSSYNNRQMPLGYLSKNAKTPYSSLLFHPSVLHTTPTPSSPLKRYLCLNNVVSSTRHMKLLRMWNFSITTSTSSKKQHCLGVGVGWKLSAEYKSAKCPRTFDDYCNSEQNDEDRPEVLDLYII